MIQLIDLLYVFWELLSTTLCSNYAIRRKLKLLIIADALDVSNIDRYTGLMHTLFSLEDIYGLTIEKRDGEIIMRVYPFNSREARNLMDELHVWCAECKNYHNGEISKDDYDKWRYNYPKYNNTSDYIKVPPQEISDMLVEAQTNMLPE